MSNKYVTKDRKQDFVPNESTGGKSHKTTSGRKGQKFRDAAKNTSQALSGASAALSAAGHAITLASKAAKSAGTAAKVAKNLKIAGQITQAAAGLAKFASVNNPEWHTSMLSGNIGVNQAKRRSDINSINSWYVQNSLNEADTSLFAFGDGSRPLSLSFMLDLFAPKTMDKENSWAQVITLIKNDLRAVNTGANNYTGPQIEHFLLSLRALHASVALADKYTRIATEIDKTDAQTPRSMLYGAGFRYIDEEIADMSNLILRVATWKDRIQQLFPIDNYLFARTRELIGNIFVDEVSEKATPYQFTIGKLFGPTNAELDLSVQIYAQHPTDAVSPTFWGNNIDGEGIPRDMFDQTNMRFSYLAENVEAYFYYLTNSTVASTITADMIKAYGRNEIVWPDSTINSPVYDETNLLMVHNADVLNLSFHSDEKNMRIPVTEYAADHKWTMSAATYPDGNTTPAKYTFQGYPYAGDWFGDLEESANYGFFSRSIRASIARRHVNRTNRYVDFWAANPDAGTILETTSWIVTAPALMPGDYDSVDSPEDLPELYSLLGAIDIISCGTEIVAGAFAVMAAKDDSLGALSWYSAGNNLIPVPIGYGANVADFSYSVGTAANPSQAWSVFGHYGVQCATSFDHCPRHSVDIIEVNPRDYSASISHIGDIWDVNDYAEISADNIATYHGISAASLLAGPNTIK